MNIKNIFKFNHFLFPFLTIMTLAFLFVESVTYSGFLSRFLVLDAKSFFFIDILSGIFLVFDKKNLKEKNRYIFLPLTKLVFQLNYLIGPVLAVFYYLMISADAANYSNFVFSTFHINPDNFIYLVFLSTLTVLLGIVLNNKKLSIVTPSFILKAPDANFKDKLSIFLVILILLLAAGNFAKTLNEIIKANAYIISHTDFTYEDKMGASWNFFYKYMSFVKQMTPETSVIAIPPSVRPWLSEGNSVLVRYFLYPRKLISPDEPASLLLSPDYYFLAKGLWTVSDESEYGWPRQDIRAQEIYYLDSTSGLITVVYGNYDFENLRNRNAWGIIKVRKI